MKACMKSEKNVLGRWLDTAYTIPEDDAVLIDCDNEGIQWLDILGFGVAAQLVAEASAVELRAKRLGYWEELCAAAELEKVRDLADLEEAAAKVEDGLYIFYPGCFTDAELGEALAECMEIPPHLAPYIDYGAIGRDERLSSGGLYTDWGYIEQ